MTHENLDDHEDEIMDDHMVSVTLTLSDGWKDDPLRVISGISDGAKALAKWQRKAVNVARKQGSTWDEIGAAAGVSRQAAWERFSTD
jgi:hypothetical protein